MVDYTDKCGTCEYFRKWDKPRIKSKGDRLKHMSSFSGVSMGKAKCKRYKPKEELNQKQASKKFTDQVMKFEITKDKLKMEISLKDLAWLLENSSNNYDENGNSGAVKVKRGKRQEFAEYVVKALMDFKDSDSDNTRWGRPLDDIFEEIFESAEDEFIKYPDSEDEE